MLQLICGQISAEIIFPLTQRVALTKKEIKELFQELAIARFEKGASSTSAKREKLIQPGMTALVWKTETFTLLQSISEEHHPNDPQH